MNDDRKDTAPAEAFYDDPNGAMGIGYSYRSVRLATASPSDAPVAIRPTAAELFDRERQAQDYQRLIAPIAAAELEAASGPVGERAPDGTIVPTNDGAYAGVDRRRRDLIDAGVSPHEATSIALEQTGSELQRSGNILGDSVVNLMKRRVARGGSGGGSRSKERAFPVRCIYPDCTLQYCDHPKPGKKRGRKAKFADRTQRVRARRSKVAGEAIRSAGLSDSDALELVGLALSSGRLFEDVLSEHREALQRQGDVA